jgi:aryl-alcohol dehydrogenase-like predicted oxidoreductase
LDSVTLGRSDLRITRIVYGAMAPRQDIDPEERKRTLHAALDAGITSIDTAPLYEFGRSEQIIGEVIKGRRGEVQLLTKVGVRWDDNHGELLFHGTGPDGAEHVVRRDSRPRSVRQDVEGSLQRLRTDVLDLVQVHQLDARTPVAETMGELVRLRDEGKLRCIGVSNYPKRHVRQAQAALGGVPLCSHQLDYSLLYRVAERDSLPLARQETIGVLAYSPLAQGRLSGRAVDDSALAQALATLRATAQAHGATPAQLALAWVLAQPGLSAAIVGASKPSQVTESAGAATLRPSAAELAELSRAFAGVQLELDYDGGRIRRALRRARRLGGRLRRLL